MTIKDVHIKTIKKYGRRKNINKAIEEFRELTDELQDNKIGAFNVPDIQEEIADCRNMLDKLEIIFNLSNNETCEIQRNKMIRTNQRL